MAARARAGSPSANVTGRVAQAARVRAAAMVRTRRMNPPDADGATIGGRGAGVKRDTSILPGTGEI